MVSTNQIGHFLIQSIVLLVILVFKPVSNNRSGWAREEFKAKFQEYKLRGDSGLGLSGNYGANNNLESDHFNLFNLFSVFRGTESRLLDEHGNLIPLDATPVLQTTPPPAPYAKSKVKSKVSSRALELSSSTARDFSYFNNLLAGHSLGTGFPSDKSQGEEKSPEMSQMPSPIILIPGYGGSRLEGRWKKLSVARYFCDLQSDWTDVWINVKLLLPYMIDCLIDIMRLEYDPATRSTRNTQGVEIRVKDQGSVSSVEYLNPMPLTSFGYFAPIVDKLLRSMPGYRREHNVLGAPYDFRKAPNELADHFDSIKSNTELLLSQSNGLKRITYICHSMGCNQMLYFLQRQSRDWKERHVRRLISLAAPWAGSFSALRAAAIGDDLGMPYLFSESKLIKVQRSVPSTIFLFPHKDVFGDVPLIKSHVVSSKIEQARLSNNTGELNFENSTDAIHQIYHNLVNNESEKPQQYYTINNIEAFFTDINHPDGYNMWLDTKDLLGSLEAPGVEVWCLVGRGQKTLGRMEFSGPFPNSPAAEIYDEGDGTVTLESAKYCTNWIGKQKEAVILKEFDISHNAILKDNHVLDYIRGIMEQD